MGWSNYMPSFVVSFHVDAHGGERQKRGEELYEKCAQEISDAIQEIVDKPQYAEINPFFM